MGALCCKKQYQRRLVRILAVLAPSALFLVCLVSLAGQANAESSRTVRINEIMAKNLSGLQGQDGQPVDWVELYNASEQPVSLKGAGLSNKAGDAYAWEFPEYILAPGEYLVVYADGLDCADETGFHTPFHLSGSGGTLTLTAPNGTVLDKLVYPKQKWDVPYGRLQQTPEQSGFFAAATPGSANPAAFWGGEAQAAQPGEAVTFSHSAGSYTKPFVLQMEALDEAAIILYTLDGSEPNTGSLLYTKSVPIRDLTGMPNRYVSVLSSTESLGSDTREFVWTDEAGNTSVSAAHMLQYLQPRLEPVSKAVTVRARTCKDGKLGETITTATYFVNSEQGFPRVSITTDPELLFNSQNGLLVPGGLHWTAAALGAAQSQNIANYMADASVAVNCEIFSADGTRQSSQSGTMRLSGNASRLEKQKSLLFTDETGQSIKLRAQHNNNVVYYPYLDAFWKNYLSQQQIGAVENSFVDLYIDGEYWGIYSLQNTVTGHLAAVAETDKKQLYLCKFKSLMAQEQNYGIEIANGGSEAQQAFAEFRSQVCRRDFRREEDMRWLESQMDVDELIRYLAAEFYLQNSDWESNNVSFWKTKQNNGTSMGDGRWRQVLYDLDMTMSFVTIDTIGRFLEIDFSQGTPEEWNALLEQKIARDAQHEEDFFPLLVCKLWQSQEFRLRFKQYAMQAYAADGIYGAQMVLPALQEHFALLSTQMERNLRRLYGGQGIEDRMQHWAEQSRHVCDFAAERAEYMLWYTNRACYGC